LRALAAISVAATANNTDQVSATLWSQGSKGFFQGIWSMGIVYDDT
jgi:hypothetical protein